MHGSVTCTMHGTCNPINAERPCCFPQAKSNALTSLKQERYLPRCPTGTGKAQMRAMCTPDIANNRRSVFDQARTAGRGCHTTVYSHQLSRYLEDICIGGAMSFGGHQCEPHIHALPWLQKPCICRRCLHDNIHSQAAASFVISNCHPLIVHQQCMLGNTSFALFMRFTGTELAPLQELEICRNLCLQLLQALCNRKTTPSQNTRLVAPENVSAAGTTELQNR